MTPNKSLGLKGLGVIVGLGLASTAADAAEEIISKSLDVNLGYTKLSNDSIDRKFEVEGKKLEFEGIMPLYKTNIPVEIEGTVFSGTGDSKFNGSETVNWYNINDNRIDAKILPVNLKKLNTRLGIGVSGESVSTNINLKSPVDSLVSQNSSYAGYIAEALYNLEKSKLGKVSVKYNCALRSGKDVNNVNSGSYNGSATEDVDIVEHSIRARLEKDWGKIEAGASTQDYNGKSFGSSTQSYFARIFGKFSDKLSAYLGYGQTATSRKGDNSKINQAEWQGGLRYSIRK